MDRDDNLSKPPPLPPPKARPARKKRSFWRTPVGVLAAIGLFLAVLIFAALFAYGIAMGTGIVPDAAAVAGGELPARVVALLQEHEVVEADERVIYYYSAGVFDHLADGHLISEDRVVWFWRDEDNAEAVETYWLDYTQIEDITVVWAESFLDDTVITFVDEDGDEIEIYVSSDDGGDRKYHKQLLKLWRKHR
ncbi:MAG: hypothetical protein ACI91B_004703 [Planctomycetota bacterium]|jgi:hypothetical protein